jgi:hypothetical protein
LRFEACDLFFELLLTPFELATPPPVLIQQDYSSKISLCQAVDLLPQAHPAPS